MVIVWLWELIYIGEVFWWCLNSLVVVCMGGLFSFLGFGCGFYVLRIWLDCSGVNDKVFVGRCWCYFG